MLANQSACWSVVVLYESSLARWDKKKMIRKEVKEQRMEVLFKTMELKSWVVVNENMLFLGHCKHGLIMQETHIPDLLLHTEFTT